MAKRVTKKKPPAVDFPAAEPVTIGDAAAAVMDRLKEQGVELKSASGIPAQLPAPEIELEAWAAIDAARERKSLIGTPSQPEPKKPPKPPDETTLEPSPQTNGKHPKSFVERVKPRQAVPEGFMNVDSYPEAGVKVNKSLDRSTFAIQYAEDKRPSPEESRLMAERDIKYDPQSRQWTRSDRDNPGANGVDAKRVGQEIADARVGRVR